MLAFFGSNINAQSAADQVSSSTYTQAEKLWDATIICWDAAEAPTKHNAFAKQFINASSFPVKKASAKEKEFQNEIKTWLSANPSLIDKVLVERKKAHDILYGPRPY